METFVKSSLKHTHQTDLVYFKYLIDKHLYFQLFLQLFIDSCCQNKWSLYLMRGLFHEYLTWKQSQLLFDVYGEVVGITHAGMEPTDHWIFQAVPHNLSVITVCFRSLHENIAWFALHVSRPHADDQTLCGWLAQFALITSFSRSHDERAEDSVVSPLFNKVLREEVDEWKCHCNRRLGCTLQRLLQSVCLCVCSCWRSASIIKKLHLVLPRGTDITTCPCTGTCSAVGPPDRSNTCSRNKPNQFLPSYNLRVAAPCFYYTPTHTFVRIHEIYSLNAWFNRSNLE